jgi:microcystin-dependent protein
LQGDITSNSISFTGAQVGGTATFTTVISSDFINTKIAVLDSNNSDELIINRIGTGLRKTNKQTFLANVATIPTGTILPFAGTTVPNGYLLCDGSEQLISSYPELFAIIGYTYKPLVDILGVSTFGIPDLRGRFPLGKDSMNNGTLVPLLPTGETSNTTIDPAADRVTAVTADTVGMYNGAEDKTLTVNNLPQHRHNLQGNAGGQYYAFRNTPGAPDDTDASSGLGATATSAGQYLTNSGPIVASGALAVPFNTMNPYLTINYIIFTGRII